MKIIILYRSKSDHGRLTEEYANQLKKFHPDLNIDMIENDSQDGISKANIYGIMSFPTILVVDDRLTLINYWTGAMFPTMDEVASYAR